MTKKLLTLLSILLIAVLVLAACSPGEQEEPTDIGEQPGVLETETFPAETAALDEAEGLPTEVVGTEVPLETEAEPTIDATSAAEATVEPGTSGTPAAEQTQAPEVRGAEILPATGRSTVTQLSNLLGFQVVDANGASLGTVNDYILNLCEAHILYVVLDAAPAQGVTEGDQSEGNQAQGNQILIPYEVVTLGGGALEVDQQAIVLDIDASQLSDAPSANQKPDLASTEWEADVRDYWDNVVNLSNLTTGCRVAAPNTVSSPSAGESSVAQTTPESEANEQATAQAGDEIVDVTKIAYASEVLSMPLQDGNGNPLGQVEEVILVPESGLLRYVAVRPDESLQAGQELILAPIRAVNLSQEEEGDAGQAVLVLLVEQNVLENAPRFSAVPDTSDDSWQEEAFQYWRQHVPLTEEEAQP